MVHYEPGGQGIALWPPQLHRAALQPALQPHDGTLRQAPNKVGNRSGSQGNGNGSVGELGQERGALKLSLFSLSPFYFWGRSLLLQQFLMPRGSRVDDPAGCQVAPFFLS